MGVKVIDPIEKILVCKEKGIGAMASVDDIVETVLSTCKNLKE